MMNIHTCRQVFRLSSILLAYPEDDLVAAVPELQQEVEWVDDDETTACFRRFLAFMQDHESMDLRSTYVATFDFGRMTNLYVTYGDFGETRERGRALLELKNRYAQSGFAVRPDELPDYLPVILEFAAVAPVNAVAPVLADHRKAIETIYSTLVDGENPYADLVKAVLSAMAAMEDAVVVTGGLS